MESVALSDEQLTYLAQQDPILRRHFVGVFPCDRLPKSPSKSIPSAYIVNTDPYGKPGRHWFAVWTENGVCEIMDSYGMPLTYYQAKPLEKWIHQWKYNVTNSQALQSVQSNSCGHYCFFYLKAKSNGHSLSYFLNLFSDKDYVNNDHIIGQMLKRFITNKQQWEHICQQSYSQTCTSCQ